MIPRELDGWLITIEDDDVENAFPVKAIATKDGQHSEYGQGKDLESALLWLCKKTGLDRRTLLAMYGIH